jgi:hypothetical protein
VYVGERWPHRVSSGARITFGPLGAKTWTGVTAQPPRHKVKDMGTSSDSAFERDIFISYAQLDNEPLTAEESGWVSTFHNALQKRLGQLLGRKPDIWRDSEKLKGNDKFGDEIVAQFPKLKVMVSILSPRYVKSDWCLRELRAFHEAATAHGGISLGNKLRVFKVVKTPIQPPDEQPAEIGSVLGYDFYRLDESSGRFREFNLGKNSPTYGQFIERFEDLAQDISSLLKRLDQGVPATNGSGSNGEDVPPERTVYLATTTSDLNPERDKIRRELEERGYQVLPNQELPLDNRLRETVREYLGRCMLAVHLIGGKYGLVPEDEQTSLLDVQQELSQQSKLARIFWLPSSISSNDPRQRRFLDNVQNQAPSQPGTELLTGNIEDLKTEIVSELEKLPTRLEQQDDPPDTDDGPARIYLIYDEADRDGITEIDDYLFDQGVDVLKPVFHGDESEIRQLHQDQLRLCDATLIYHNQSSEAWLSFKMNDLRKARGYRAGKPFKANAIYIGGASNRFKQQVRSRDALVIKQFGAFSTDDLTPFVAAISPEQGGAR